MAWAWASKENITSKYFHEIYFLATKKVQESTKQNSVLGKRRWWRRQRDDLIHPPCFRWLEWRSGGGMVQAIIKGGECPPIPWGLTHTACWDLLVPQYKSTIAFILLKKDWLSQNSKSTSLWNLLLFNAIFAMQDNGTQYSYISLSFSYLSFITPLNIFNLCHFIYTEFTPS